GRECPRRRLLRSNGYWVRASTGFSRAPVLSFTSSMGCPCASPSPRPAGHTNDCIGARWSFGGSTRTARAQKKRRLGQSQDGAPRIPKNDQAQRINSVPNNPSRQRLKAQPAARRNL